MREDLRLNNDVVFREFHTHRYILIKNWHNPSMLIKIIRNLNRIVLAMLILALTFYAWNKYISVKNVILSLAIIFNPLFIILIASLFSDLTKEIVTLSKNSTLGNRAKRVEYNIYQEYLKKVSANRWLPLIIMMFLFFVCILSLIISQHKWNLHQIENFWKYDKDNCISSFISLFGILAIVLNLLFFTTLHFNLGNTLRNKIYNNY